MSGGATGGEVGGAGGQPAQRINDLTVQTGAGNRGRNEDTSKHTGDAVTNSSIL
jgi:hypothetical protein